MNVFVQKRIFGEMNRDKKKFSDENRINGYRFTLRCRR